MQFVIDYDQDADFSTMLEPYNFPDKTADDFVALEMVLYDDDGDIRGSLCNITFFNDGDDWVTGNFDSVEDIPERCEHLREVATSLLADYNFRQDSVNDEMPTPVEEPTHALNARERATMIAALELWKREGESAPSELREIANGGLVDDELTSGEIDALCSRLRLAVC